MVNQSKTNDPRFWAKWRASGAVGNIYDSLSRTYESTAAQLAAEGRLTIEAIGEHYAGLAEGYSALSLGRRLVNSGPDFSATEPVLAVLVPGHGYQLGQKLPALPSGCKLLEQVFASA